MPLTPNDIREKFQADGITITQWANENGYKRHAVYRVLGGFDKAHYGQAHEIAVKLGLKDLEESADNALGFDTTQPPLPPAPALPDPVHHTADAASSDTLACLLCPACGASLSVYVDPTHGSS
nr:DNA-binding protein [Ketobacter sp.]